MVRSVRPSHLHLLEAVMGETVSHLTAEDLDLLAREAEWAEVARARLQKALGSAQDTAWTIGEERGA